VLGEGLQVGQRKLVAASKVIGGRWQVTTAVSRGGQFQRVIRD
jgi:hypothetical protein